MMIKEIIFFVSVNKDWNL